MSKTIPKFLQSYPFLQGNPSDRSGAGLRIIAELSRLPLRLGSALDKPYNSPSIQDYGYGECTTDVERIIIAKMP